MDVQKSAIGNDFAMDEITVTQYLRDCDNDGIGNMYDLDADNVKDCHDLDSDNDGIFDVIVAGGVDPNLDGSVGVAFIDDNLNGLHSDVDPNEAGIGLVNMDSESDGTADAKELDSDNDGCFDVVEAGFPDVDVKGYLGTGTIGSGLTVNIRGVVTP
ncbi:MAG: hypothetical protein ACI8XB_002288 [Patiriisocius sp.]|jgi:hypothetical protein